MLFINKLFNSIACLLSFTNLQLVIPGRTWILLYLGRTVYKRLWACLALYFVILFYLFYIIFCYIICFVIYIYIYIYTYMLSTCSIFLEINPACSNITCQNGGSCMYTNETSNAICSCYSNFAGEFCEGIYHY